jgi:hypothetical protein
VIVVVKILVIALVAVAVREGVLEMVVVASVVVLSVVVAMVPTRTRIGNSLSLWQKHEKLNSVFCFGIYLRD